MGDRVGVELLFNSVVFESKKQLPVELQTARDQMWQGKPHPTEGALRNPDGVDPSIRRTRNPQRDGHNSWVKIWSLCSVPSTLSHANLEQPFRTLAMKREVNIIVKMSSCVFILASLSLCRCELFYVYMCMYVDVNLHMWLYNISFMTQLPKYLSYTLQRNLT